MVAFELEKGSRLLIGFKDSYIPRFSSSFTSFINLKL
jgi:hypothetical protein